MKNKVLFVYNNINDIKGYENVFKAKKDFENQNPDIKVEMKPVSKTNSFSNVEQYDKVYIDETINTFVESQNYSKLFEFSVYNRDTFEQDGVDES